MSKEKNASGQYFWARVLAIFTPIAALVGGVMMERILTESPDICQARKAYDAFLDEEIEDNRNNTKVFKDISFASLSKADTEERIKSAIDDRLKVIRAKIGIKTSLSFFRGRTAQPKPARLKRIQELKEKKEKIWKEIQGFDDPEAEGFIPAPELPEGALTTAIFRRVHMERQNRHNQKLDAVICYLDVAKELIEFPSEDLKEVNRLMKERAISISQTTDNIGRQGNGII